MHSTMELALELGDTREFLALSWTDVDMAMLLAMAMAMLLTTDHKQSLYQKYCTNKAI